jgi:sporulation protein YlmC with PRC-barrel domain
MRTYFLGATASVALLATASIAQTTDDSDYQDTDTPRQSMTQPAQPIDRETAEVDVSEEQEELANARAEAIEDDLDTQEELAETDDVTVPVTRQATMPAQDMQNTDRMTTQQRDRQAMDDATTSTYDDEYGDEEERLTQTETTTPDLDDTSMTADSSAELLNRAEASQDGMRIKDLIGAPIRGATGERIARVDDLVIGADGRIETVVFLHGGFAGLGAERGSIPYSEVELQLANEDDPRLRVSMTEDSLESIAAYEANELREFRLASELVGSNASLQADEDEVLITDLLVDSNGVVQSAVVAQGFLAQFTDDLVLVPFNRVSIAQGDGGVVIDMTEADFDSAVTYDRAARYNRTESETTDSDTRTNMRGDTASTRTNTETMRGNADNRMMENRDTSRTPVPTVRESEPLTTDDDVMDDDDTVLDEDTLRDTGDVNDPAYERENDDM